MTRENIPYPPRLRLARLPTPIDPLHFSQLPSGMNLLIKRDDLTGNALAGNKIRKLEYLLADAKKKRCDTIITCGGMQSNHARAVAVASATLGCRSVLFLRGKRGSAIEGNLMLDHVVGAETRFISADKYRNRRNQIMQEYAEKIAIKGRRPYVICEGGSNAIGTWGYVRAIEELHGQVKRRGIKLRSIVTALGSGGTYSGLLLGTKLLNWKIPVFGVNICDDRSYFEGTINNILQETISRYGLKIRVRPSEIRILDGYVGEGYAMASPQVLELIQRVASETGIIFDPVYTGKAFLGMLEEIKRGTFGNKGTLMFLHSGGLFGLLTREYSAFYKQNNTSSERIRTFPK